MNNFKSLNTRKFLHTRSERTDDFSYWKQLSQPVLIKENAIVDYIDFSPLHPHNFAVTCSARIQIYNPITIDKTQTLSRFQKTAYGATFGKNGKLLVCGDEDGHVTLFETNTKRNLRSFQGHKAGVHRTFFTADKLHIASFSDDKTVRLWDIASEQCVQTFAEHTAYIRAGCVNPVSPNILLSGGYDNKVKMYDTRTSSVVFEVNHDSPVHSVLFLPTGGIFITSGGTHVKVWDAFAGGRLLAMMTSHTRDVHCLRLASNGRRLLSGGLDRKVKIYDTSTYRTVHTLDFPNGVTSMAVAPSDETLVVGMLDGIVSVQRMDSERKIKTLERRNIPAHVSSTTDQLVADYKPQPEAAYDKKLRKYEYSLALQDVLNPERTNKTPHITVGLINELMRRKGLERAVKGLAHSFLVKFITFLIRYMGDRRFMRTLIDATNCLLTAFEDDLSNLSGEVAKKFLELGKTVTREQNLLFDCLGLEGAYELLFSGASVADESSNVLMEYGRDLNSLQPSKTVEEDFVVRIDE